MLSACTNQYRADFDATPTPSHTRILIADDDPDTLDVIELAVRGPGIDTYLAEDGVELLELIAECGRFDLIITDVNMPWIEGLQVLASIRAAGLDTPVLVVTGLDRPQLSAAVARLGNARLLHKPFEVADLRSAIAALLAGDS